MKVDLNACVLTRSFKADHRTVAKFLVADRLAQLERPVLLDVGSGLSVFGRLGAGPGPLDLHAWPDFLYQTVRDFGQETGWPAMALGAEHPPDLRVAETQVFPCPGHADITQASFFLESSPGLGYAALMREQAIFHANDEHDGELKSLGGMQGHQLHAVIPGLTLCLTGLKRRVAQERL